MLGKVSSGNLISCEGASHYANIGIGIELSSHDRYQIKIDGVIIYSGFNNIEEQEIEGVFIRFADSISFENVSTTNRRVEFLCTNDDITKHQFKPIPQEIPNASILFADQNEENGNYSKVSFCLSPQVESHCYNFTQAEVDNLALLQPYELGMSLNAYPSQQFPPLQLDEYFTLSINNESKLFKDVLIDQSTLTGEAKSWFRDSSNPLLKNQGFWIGYNGTVVSNWLAFIYSNPNDANDVAVVKICSKVSTANLNKTDWISGPIYDSAWLTDPVGEGSRYDGQIHALIHVDENGYESVVIKVQSTQFSGI